MRERAMSRRSSELSSATKAGNDESSNSLRSRCRTERSAGSAVGQLAGRQPRRFRCVGARRLAAHAVSGGSVPSTPRNAARK